MVRFNDAVLLPNNPTLDLHAAPKQYVDPLQTYIALQTAKFEARNVSDLGYYVASGLTLSPSATAGKLQMDAGVSVAASLAVAQSAQTTITGGDTAHDDITEMANGSYPKWVCVELDGTTVQYNMGTAEAFPKIPAWTTTRIPLGLLYIPAGATNSTGIDSLITTDNGKCKLYDMRMVLGLDGAWQTYTPVIRQNGSSLSLTSNDSRYTQIRKTVTGQIRVAISGAGTANTVLDASMPVSCKQKGATVNVQVGSFEYYDTSTTDRYRGVAQTVSDSDIFALFATSDATPSASKANLQFGQVPNLAAASGDILQIFFSYEAQ